MIARHHHLVVPPVAHGVQVGRALAGDTKVIAEETVVAVATPSTTRFFEPVRSGLESLGHRVRSYDDPTAFLNDAAALTHANVLLANGSIPIGPGVLSRAPRVAWSGFAQHRTEGFDIAAATERGIVVANGQTRENVESMAEATVLLILEVLHDLADARAQLRAGRQRGGQMRSRMLRGRTVGLIGFGQIAQAAAERLAGWKVDILVSAPRRHAALPPHGRHVELDELLAVSDIVSIHAALNEETLV